ncbi:MAG: hypothetical protein ACOCP8_00790 [archaeon]
MKRLISKKQKYIPQVGDQVQWKNHPYDTSTYEVTEILPDGTVFMDNGINSYTNIKSSVIKLVITNKNKNTS